MNFNPRFPRGKRPRCDEAFLRSGLFQSTLPAGEATPAAVLDLVTRNFNPRFPRGKRQRSKRGIVALLLISIHASRGGSDVKSRPLDPYIMHFNPRFPRGKRLPRDCQTPMLSADFNPRFPRGKRLSRTQRHCRFYSISIHASRGGSDPRSQLR